jgi:hypothetical protein
MPRPKIGSPSEFTDIGIRVYDPTISGDIFNQSYKDMESKRYLHDWYCETRAALEEAREKGQQAAREEAKKRFWK